MNHGTAQSKDVLIRKVRIHNFICLTVVCLTCKQKGVAPFTAVYCTYPHIEGGRMRFFPAREIARSARELQDAGR